MSKSEPHPDNPFRSATLHFDVACALVTITDVVVDPSGRHQRGTNTIRADGEEHDQGNGYLLLARWVGSHALEAVVTRNGQLEGRVRYEVSADGQTLRLSANERVSLFERTRVP